MTDKIFKKQLERFGIESIRVVEGNADHQRQQKHFEGSINIVRALMDTMEGRQWMYNKLDFYCVFSTPFVPGKPDSTAFLCGLQEAGHQLQNEIMIAASDKYYEMIQEAATRNQKVD